ncbi:MAG: hypothetical protein R3F20_12655 [Planctomycetota bacterium]
MVKGRRLELESALAIRHANYEPREWDPLRRVEDHHPPADAAELVRRRYSAFLPEVPRLPDEGGPR